MWRIETPRWIMPSATMICSLVSFTPVSPRRWSGPETAHYKRFVNPRCAKLGVPREAKWRVLLHGVMVAFIDAYRERYGVEPICSVLPIAPSTYYACKARERDPSLGSARARREAVLREEIQRVW